MYFKWSKNSISWNIRAPKYPFFNEELKIWSKLFILNFWSSQFLRLLRPCRNERKWFWRKQGRSVDSEVEATWASLIGWPHKTSIMYLNYNKAGPTVCATPITVIWPITSTVTKPIIKMGSADTMGPCLLKEGHISDTLLHGMCKPHCGNLPCYAFCYGPHAHCTGSWLALSFGADIVKMIDLSKTATRDFFDIILDQKYPQELHLFLKYW